jgi:hypothetical protein
VDVVDVVDFGHVEWASAVDCWRLLVIAEMCITEWDVI